MKSNLEISWSGQNLTARQRTVLALIACLALALVLRVVRRPAELLSSDAADLASLINSLVCSDKSLTKVGRQLLLFRLGAIQPVVVYLHGAAARLLDVNIEPTAWEWSTIVTGALSAPLAFLTGRGFGGALAGWAWGIFVATSPIHVMLGRNLGAPWAYEINFQLLLLWLIRRYLAATSSPATTRAALGVTLGLYLWCGNQAMAILPVLGFALVAHATARPKAERFEFARSKLCTWWFVLPFVSAALLTFCTFWVRKGHFYHALFEKRKAVGWYGQNFYTDLVYNIGYVPAWACLVAFLLSCIAPHRAFDVRRVPLVYAISYALPFVVLVGPGTTLTRGYSVYGVTALFGLVALTPAVVRGIAQRLRVKVHICNVGRTSYVFVGFIAGILMLGTGSSVYRYYAIRSVLGVKSFQGAFGEPMGAAVAAAFIRRLAYESKLSGRVFSDAYGGRGLEPPVMKLYFRRPFYAHYDAARLTPYKAFAPKAAHIDFAVIRPENRELVAKYFPALRLAARAQRKVDDELALLIYARDYRAPVATIFVADGVETYTEVFPRLCER